MRLFTLLFLVCFFLDISAQNIDVAPFLTQCKDKTSLQESVDCSESLIYDYFLMEIDENLCPANDSSSHYSINIDVNKKGRASFNSIYNYEDREHCKSYFKKKAKEISKEFDFIPATYKGKDQPFRKKISFFYPKHQFSSDDTTGVYKRVEQMPRFNSCESIIGSSLDKESCAQNDMLQFIYENLRYPMKARKNGVMGMVVVQFVIDEAGNIQDSKIVKDIGADCGIAVLEIMDKMAELKQPFIPGIQYGEHVKVLYTLPVRFKLEKNKRKKRKKKKKN